MLAQPRLFRHTNVDFTHFTNLKMIASLFAFAMLLSLFIGVTYIAIFLFRQINGGNKENTTLLPATFPALSGWILGSMVLAYNLFFHEYLFGSNSPLLGMGIGLFCTVLFAGALLAFPKENRTWPVWSLAGVGTLCAWTFAFIANDFTLTLNAWVIVGCAFSLGILSSVQDGKGEISWIFRSLLRYFMNAPHHFIQLFQLSRNIKDKGSQKTLRAVKTGVITLVVLLFFASLLSNADPIFEHLLKNVLDQAWERGFLSLVILLGTAFILSYKLKSPESSSTSLKWFSYYDLAIPMAGLLGIFGVFLFIQAEYLFADAFSFTALKISYSDYVRQGFTELLTVTFFGTLVSAIVSLKQKEISSHAQVLGLKLLNSVLILELLAVLGSALKRDLLYIESYDLTRIRIVGLVFLAWLACFLALLLFFNWNRSKEEARLMRAMLLPSLLALLYFNVGHMDLTIASQPPTEDKQIDYFYMTSLSPETAATWGEGIEASRLFMNNLTTQKEPFTKDQLKRFAELKLALLTIQDRKNKIENRMKEYPSLLYRNLEEKRAMQLFTANPDLFEDKLSCVLTQMKNTQIFHQIDLQEQEGHRLWEYRQPLISSQNVPTHYSDDAPIWEYMDNNGADNGKTYLKDPKFKPVVCE